MTTPVPLPTCPACDGQQVLPHYNTLTFRDLNDCSLRSAEDSRLVADRYDGRRAFKREATSAEVAMLAAFGAAIPGDLTVRVEWLSASARRRRFVSRQSRPLTTPAAP